MRYISDAVLKGWLDRHSVGRDHKGIVCQYLLDKPIVDDYMDDSFADMGFGERNFLIKPSDCDLKPIAPGDHVWGQDGREWVVDGIGGERYNVIGHEVGKDLNHTQSLMSVWLSHERPAMTRRQVAKELRKIGTFDTPDTPRWSAINERLARLADELERGDD